MTTRVPSTYHPQALSGSPESNAKPKHGERQINGSLRTMLSLGGIARHAWSVICWIVLSGLVAGMLAALYFYGRVDNELERFVLTQLSKAYPHLTVSVGSARFIQGEGVRVNQISLVRAGSAERNTRSELAYIDSVDVMCGATLPALLSGDLTIDRVTVRGLAMTVEALPSGRPDVTELMPRNVGIPSGPKIPQIIFEKTTLQLHDARDGPARALELNDIELRLRLKQIEAKPESAARVEWSASLTPQAADSNTPSGSARHAGLLLAYDGELRTRFCHHLTFSGGLRTTDGAWTLQARMRDVDLASQTVERLPSCFADRLATSAIYRGRAEVQLRARQDRGAPLRVALEGNIVNGTWQEPGWPRALSDLNFHFVASESGFEIQELSGRYGDAELHGNLAAAGFDVADDAFDCSLEFQRFPITQRLVQSLPAAVQAEWKKLHAVGLLSGRLDCHRNQDGLDYLSELTCEGMSIQHYKFPYRVSNCRGTVRLNSQRCEFELEGMAGETPVALSGELQHPGPGYVGWWEVAVDRWKSIDDALIAALPADAQRIVRELELRGRVKCSVRGTRRYPFRRERPEIVVEIDDGSINYKKFPYPVGQVRGRIETSEFGWRYSQLEGWNDGCRVRLDGQWDKYTDDGDLDLTFQLDNIRLDEELRKALPLTAQQTWAHLRPRGAVDHAEVYVSKTKQQARPRVDVHLIHHPQQRQQQPMNTVHLHPQSFPLPLTNVQGEAYLNGQSISLRSVTAENGKTRFRTHGKGTVLPNGRWRMNLTESAVDHIRLREPVLNALPKKLAAALRRLKLQGLFSLAGAIHFVHDDPLEPVTSGWDLTLNVERGQLVAASTPIESVFGQIQFSGASHGDQVRCRGQLKLDSLMARNVQLTNVQGPVWIDNSKLILGQRVPTSAANPTRVPVTANVYQGRLTTNSEVAFDPDLPFRVEMSLTNMDMALLARDWRIGAGNLAGRGQVDVTLIRSPGRQTVRGTGRAQLRDATMYELPLIFAVLNRISSGRRDNTAFTSSDVAFRVQDGYVYFDQFDLSGDAITLKGRGEMSFDRQISLDFYTIMGREQRWSPIVRPFIGQTSRQFLQIHVNGPLDAPRATREVLPGINETLRQLFPEQTDVPRQTARRRFLPR